MTQNRKKFMYKINQVEKYIQKLEVNFKIFFRCILKFTKKGWFAIFTIRFKCLVLY